MNTCRLNLWGFDVERTRRANRTLRVNAGTLELEDSFQLVTLNGNCFYGHQVSLDVSSMPAQSEPEQPPIQAAARK
jgi:hypothetical protein